MNTDTALLPPRHERFVAEYLKDGNATQAYIRAGYSPRGAQPSASRLLRDPRIEAAIAAGRQQMAQALEVSVERLAQEYAKIAFASIDDFVSVDADGRVRIDLEKANQAQQAGIVELKIANHRNGEQHVTLKLGKLQALAALTKNVGILVAKPAPGLTAEDRQYYEGRCAAYERSLNHREREKQRVEEQLREARAALEQHGADLQRQLDDSKQENRRLEQALDAAQQRQADPPSGPETVPEALAMDEATWLHAVEGVLRRAWGADIPTDVAPYAARWRLQGRDLMRELAPAINRMALVAADFGKPIRLDIIDATLPPKPCRTM